MASAPLCRAGLPCPCPQLREPRAQDPALRLVNVNGAAREKYGPAGEPGLGCVPGERQAPMWAASTTAGQRLPVTALQVAQPIGMITHEGSTQPLQHCMHVLAADLDLARDLARRVATRG